MSTPARVTHVHLVRTRPKNGLLGYVSCTVANLRIDGLTLRRTRDGRFAISFPCRRDGHGRKHPIVRARDGSLERAILSALRRQGALLRKERRERARPLPGNADVHPAPDHRPEEARSQLGGGELHDEQGTGSRRTP